MRALWELAGRAAAAHRRDVRRDERQAAHAGARVRASRAACAGAADDDPAAGRRAVRHARRRSRPRARCASPASAPVPRPRCSITPKRRSFASSRATACSAAFARKRVPSRRSRSCPRLDLTPEARAPRVLNEAEIFACTRCGKPMGTEKLVPAMVERLRGHSMFAGAGSLARLKMCADCRVVDLMTNERTGGHPGTRDAGSRPHVRRRSRSRIRCRRKIAAAPTSTRCSRGSMPMRPTRGCCRRSRGARRSTATTPLADGVESPRRGERRDGRRGRRRRNTRTSSSASASARSTCTDRTGSPAS